MGVHSCSKYVGVLTLGLWWVFGAAAQPGFLSIDCGGRTARTDHETGIEWVTDENFIDSGEIKELDKYVTPFYFQSLRVFPMPLNKSCYRLPLTPNVPHLLRVCYGGVNYTIKKHPNFKYSIETQEMLYLKNVSTTKLPSENILVSFGSILHLCLIRSSPFDDPFISSIELRTLKQGMYPQAKPEAMLHLYCRYDVGGSSVVRSIDNNHLTGGFPDLSNLMKLERLHLQNNNMSGIVPDWLSKLQNLKELFIQNNSFSGVIPQKILDNCSMKIKYDGNRYLCMNGACRQSCNSTSSNESKMGIIVGVTAGGVILVVLAFLTGVIMYKRKLRNERTTRRKGGVKRYECGHVHDRDFSMVLVPNPSKSRVFTLDEMLIATEQFTNKIGEGGFGSVFLGMLQEGNKSP